MKLLVQRVSEASVTVDGTCVGTVGAGYLVFAGCRNGDTERDVAFLADKLVALRVFEDEAGKMNRSITQTGGSVLLVSQFTLYADTRKGNRPSFVLAGDPVRAETLFTLFVDTMRRRLGAERIATGIFGAEMKVALINDGPVTIELCSDAQPWHAGAVDSQMTLRMISTDEDIATTFRLVSAIWPVCYRGILTDEQMRYMLERMYAPETIQREMDTGTPFFLVEMDGAAIGVVSYDKAPRANGVIVLHKIYLLPEYWGRGLGGRLMAEVFVQALKAGAAAVELNVNRANDRAVKAYRRAGFAIKQEVTEDIGGGFVKIDYIMRKELQ